MQNLFKAQLAQESKLFKKIENVLLKEKEDLKNKLEREKQQSFFVKHNQSELWTKERNELQERMTRLQAANVALEVTMYY